MKKTAEDYLGTEVTGAVITVPAYFNDSQRQATKEAGEIAGLEVKRALTSRRPPPWPMASTRSPPTRRSWCSTSVAEPTTWRPSRTASSLSTDGDTHLGGDDRPGHHRLVGEEFKAENALDLSKDPMALQRLKEAAEKAKIELSSTNSTEINPYIMPVDGVPKHLVRSMSRSKFEQLTDALVKRTIEPCQTASKPQASPPATSTRSSSWAIHPDSRRAGSRDLLLQQGAVQRREPDEGRRRRHPRGVPAAT